MDSYMHFFIFYPLLLQVSSDYCHLAYTFQPKHWKHICLYHCVQYVHMLTTFKYGLADWITVLPQPDFECICTSTFMLSIAVLLQSDHKKMHFIVRHKRGLSLQNLSSKETDCLKSLTLFLSFSTMNTFEPTQSYLFT